MEHQTQQPQQNTQSQPPLSSPKKGIFNTKFKLFLIVALVAVVISVGGILLFVSWRLGTNPITYIQCSQLEQEIDTLINQANYCKMDSDCIVSPEVAHPGLCFNLVNKDADVSFIQQKKLQWQNLDCGKGRVYEACARVPQLVQCQENKCVGEYKDFIPDISDWQTYRNEEFGFEVRYPPDWTVNENGLVSLGKKSLDVAILVWDNGSKEYVEEQWQSVPCAPGGDSGCAPLENKEMKTIEVNGNTVYWKIDGYNQIHAYIPNEQKNKTVEIYTVNLRNRDIFDQILSTFRFVE